MGGQKKDHHLISTKTKDHPLVDTEGKLEALTPLPNITLWQSFRSYIQQFAEDHPKIYAGIIILFAIALASLFILPIIAAAGRPQSNRTYSEFDPLPNPTPLTRWSPPHHDDVAHTTPVPNLFLAERDMPATAVPLPTLEEIQDLLNQRPSGYLVPVPEDSTLDLEGPLFNLSAVFNTVGPDGPIIPAYSLDQIAETTNFDTLYIEPGTTVVGGSWAGISSNGTYAPRLQFASTVNVDGLRLSSSYIPSLHMGSENVTVTNLVIRFSHAPNITLSGTFLYFLTDSSLMPYANWSQVTFAAGTFLGLHAPESHWSNTQFIAVDGPIVIDTSFFSNVRATGSDVSGLRLSQVEGWGAGVDGGLNLTNAWTQPGSHITVINSAGQGFALSLRNMVLDGANITGNFFDPLDLRGAVVPDSAVMQYNTAIRDGVTDHGGLTIFGGTRLSETAVRNNQFGRVVCDPQTPGECNTLPLPTNCLVTTPGFYNLNQLAPECLPNITLPNVTLPTQPTTTTLPTTTSPGQNHTQPHHRPGLTPLDFSFIAVGSTFALLLIMLASNSAYKHCKTQRLSLGRNRLSLHSGSPSIQNDVDEETPLNPGANEESRACLDFC